MACVSCLQFDFDIKKNFTFYLESRKMYPFFNPRKIVSNANFFTKHIYIYIYIIKEKQYQLLFFFFQFIPNRMLSKTHKI